MGGGLMQLVAYGAQDVYLTGNPQITFFKVVYRRHTNFSVEPIQQVFNGAADFGRTVTCNINRNGDLITNMYSVIELKEASADDDETEWGYVRRLGYAVIQNCKVEIGGSKIDEQYGDWLNIWYELSHKVGQERGHGKMIGDVNELTNFAVKHDAFTLYVPLAFWFNRHNGLALPLIALQYHDVRVTIQYRDGNRCVNWNQDVADQSVLQASFGMEDSYLLIDYVYLDSEERKRFAQASHEYLIEQLQFTGSEALTNTNNKYRLNFNHPSKFLIWAPHLQKFATQTNFLAYADDGDWELARETAAKLVWIASRAGVTKDTNATTSADTYSIDKGTATDPHVATAEVGTAAAEITQKLADLAAKVDAQFAFGTDALSENTDAWECTVDNVILLNNDLTSADLSVVVSSLKNGATDNANDSFLEDNSVLVVDHFNYGRFIDGTSNPVLSAKLQLNGHDRFQARDGNYFNYVQPYQHFSNTPADGINVYSFALKPEDHQPSGTCNFSRIDNATLNVEVVSKDDLSDDSNVNIYTVNYNVLRVMSGMAGTAYSN
jgi:hypothetical protein